MGLILQLNTALQEGSVSLSENGTLLGELINDAQADHASFLHPAILELLSSLGKNQRELSAISVVHGPGSYTGLRVGMACAKGLCYALSTPLITVGTLEWMAHAARDPNPKTLCPMIDARRDEVFTALYTHVGHEIKAPFPLILESGRFSVELASGPVHFFGSGSEKFKKMIQHPNAIFTSVKPGAASLTELSWTRYLNTEFPNLAYAEPLYIKEFYTPSANHKTP